jgi:hypothetical protein
MNQRKTDFTYIAANTAKRSFIWGWLSAMALAGLVWGALLLDNSELLWK